MNFFVIAISFSMKFTKSFYSLPLTLKNDRSSEICLDIK